MSKLTALAAALVAVALASTAAIAATDGTETEPRDTYAKQCAGVEKKGGAFGRCVAEAASAKGKAKRAEKADERAAEAKAKAGESDAADATDAADGERQDADRNPTKAATVTADPKTDGRTYGRQVSEAARQGRGKGSAQRGGKHNPTTAPTVTAQPRENGREYGRQVSEAARQGHGQAAPAEPQDAPEQAAAGRARAGR